MMVRGEGRRMHLSYIHCKIAVMRASVSSGIQHQSPHKLVVCGPIYSSTVNIDINMYIHAYMHIYTAGL